MAQHRRALHGRCLARVLLALASLGACSIEGAEAAAAAPPAVVRDYDMTWPRGRAPRRRAAAAAPPPPPGAGSPSGNPSAAGRAGLSVAGHQPESDAAALAEAATAARRAEAVEVEAGGGSGRWWRELEGITTTATSATQTSTATSGTETTGTATSTLTSTTASSTSETSMTASSTSTTTLSPVMPAIPGTTDDYTTGFQLVASLNSTKTAAVCESLPEVSSPILGIPEGQLSCLGFVADGGRRLSAAEKQSRQLSEDTVMGYFQMEAAARSEEEAAANSFKAASLDVSALESALLSEDLDVDVLNVQNVLTFKDSQPWVTYGSMQITIGGQSYTDEQAGALLKDMFVAALSEVPTEGGGSFALDAGNVTVEVSDGTNVQYFINSLSAADDLVVLEQLAQSGYQASLQSVLDDQGTQITIDVFQVVFDVSGRFTVESSASTAANQQKLTDPESYSTDSMKESIRKVMMGKYNLEDEDVGISVVNIVPYVAGDASSNRIEVVYLLAPAAQGAYCAAAGDLESPAGLQRLEAALSYDGVDQSILPTIETFSADPTLGACTAPPEGGDDDDDGLLAGGLLIAVIAAGAAVIIIGAALLAFCCCLLRRRRLAARQAAAGAAAPGGPQAVTEPTFQAERPPSPDDGDGDGRGGNGAGGAVDGGSGGFVVPAHGPEEQDDEPEAAVQRGAGAYLRSDILDHEDDVFSV